MQLYEVEPARLAMMPAPTGQDDLKQLKEAGATLLVNALTKVELLLLGLRHEREMAESVGMRYIHFPIPDFGTPDKEKLSELAKELAQDAGFVVVHCRGGIGRSGLIVGATLIKRGATADQAIALMSSARGRRSPETAKQRALLASLQTPAL